MFNSLTVRDIVKTLGIKQRNSLSEFRPKKQRLYRKAPAFIYDESCESDEDSGVKEYLYIDTEIGEGDLITQLLRMINPKFQIIGNAGDIVKEFRNRLAFDLDKLKLYTKFGYSKLVSFNRKKVYNTLINKDLICRPDFFGEIFTSVVRYLVDYFDINIVIYNSDYSFENLLDVDIYHSRRDGVRLIKEKPVIEFVYTTRYCPVIDGDSGCGVRKWNSRLDKVFEKQKMNLIDYKAMSGYKLDELNKMAKGLDVNLKKVSDKTGKQIKKSKKDLYEDLYYLVKL